MAASVLEVLIVGDASQYAATLTGAAAQTKAFAATATSGAASAEKSMASMGSTTKSVVQGLGLVTAAVAVGAFAKSSFQAAEEYNAAFTKVDAITNASADQIAILKDRAMQLSGETAQSPVELANAIYYLASAGLDAQQQMESLEAVAKGTAIGLGTSADLAKITSQALNVFGDSGLRAADVMDVLTAAVRTGTAEPDEFADALGRVLPIAYKAGISFQQVAASLATMSNAGLKVNIGTTALRGLLQALVAPTHQSIMALGQMGLTVDDVVQSMAQHGLISTLRMLDTEAKKNTSTTGQYNIMLRNVIPNIRALTGAFNLTTQDAAKVDEIFQQVLNSGGDLGEAFAITAASPAFKLKQALNDISIAGQNLASSALPAVSAALSVVGDHAAGLVQVLLLLLGAKVVEFLVNWTNQAIANAAAQRAQAEAMAEAAAATQAEAAAEAEAAGASTFLMGRKVEEVVAVEADAAAKTVDATATTSLGISERFAAAGAQLLASKLLPIAALIYGAYKAAQGAKGEFDALHLSVTRTGSQFAAFGFQLHSAPDWGAYFNAANTAARAFNMSVLNTHLPTQDDFAAAQAGLDIVKIGFLQAGISAEEQGPIIQKAIQDIGGNLDVADPKQMEEFVAAIQNGIAGWTAYQQQQAQAAQVARQMASDQNALNAATEGYQTSIAKVAGQVEGLNALTGDGVGYLTDLRATLIASSNPALDFAKAIADLGDKWRDFQSAAADSLNFMPQALSDLTSAAESAQTSLDDALASPPDADASKQDIRDYNANLATLQTQAHLTGEEIVTAFKAAATQSRHFFEDLKEISQVGGQAGKDLAQSLLESGNVMAAQVIADQPGKIEKQIVHLSGVGASMADNFATKLTDSIIGPLKTISKALKIIVEKTWNIDLGADNKEAKNKTKETQDAVDHLTNPQHVLHITPGDDTYKTPKLIDDTQKKLEKVTKPWTVRLGMNKKQADNALQTFEDNLDRLTSRKYQVDVGVSTHPNSPWPDEALDQHLHQPLKQMGFRKVGQSWTLPLDVATRSDLAGGDTTTLPTVPPDLSGKGKNKGGNGAMLQVLHQLVRNQMRTLAVEKAQRELLGDIRKSLRDGAAGTGGGGGGGTGSSTSGGSGGGKGGDGHPHGSLHDISPLKSAAAAIVRMTSKSGATLNEGLGVVQRVAAQGLNPAFIRHAVAAVRQELGKSAANQYQQQLRLIDQQTKSDAERRTIARRAAYYAAHPNVKPAPIDPKRFMTPLQRSVDNIFQKEFKGGLTPGEAKGVIERVAREGRDPKFIGGAIKDMAKELGPAAAKSFGHSLRTLDASTARNAKHQQAALDAAKKAFEQMTQDARHQQQLTQKREEARQQWMADALAYATKNAPRLPEGHTNISVNHHERDRHHGRLVTLDRKRFTDSAGYEVDYGRGF